MQRFYKKYRAYIRLLSVVIAITTVAVSVVFSPSVPAFSAEDDSPYVTRAGKEIDTLELHQEDKVRLEAVSPSENEVGYCWQIKDALADRWYNVSGVHSKSIFISYALVSSMLDSNENAYIRCKLTEGDKSSYTDAVKISMIYAVDDSGDFSASVNYEKRKPILRAEKPTEEEPVIHTITINYLFDNNTVAFEPYGASVARDSDFTATVTSPTIVGYAPYRRVGDDYIEADKVLLDYTDIRQNITIDIIYKPAPVDFSVHHHLQNIYNDGYSETYDYITTSKALTGSVVPDGLHMTEADLPGFRPLAYEHLTVAADGSTVIEIRYDRNYYLIDFDMNGGYGTEPVYTRYESSVGANVPIRHGYLFDGWELVSFGGNEPTEEQKKAYELKEGTVITVPDANLRYRAKWITQMTTYTLVFWRENANDNEFSYWGHIADIPIMSGSIVDGEDRIREVRNENGVDEITDEDCFTFNSLHTDKNVIVEGDGSTVVNVRYSRNYYKIYFKDSNYNCTIDKNHKHDDDCKELICGYGHTHGDECERYFVCPLNEHTAHTPECLNCGFTQEHAHGDAICECKYKEHTHSIGCYGVEAGDIYNRKPSGAPNNPSHGEVYVYDMYFWSSKYIYLYNSWYSYSGSESSGTIITNPPCDFEYEHSHSSACCTIAEHLHSDSCYADVIHSHSNSCYGYSCGYEQEHTHDDSCFRDVCGIPENHTCTSTCKNTVKYVYRKYDQSLKDIWPVVGDNGVSFSESLWQSSVTNKYYSFLEKMHGYDITMTNAGKLGNYKYTWYYYLEVLPGQDTTGLTLRENGGKTYYLYYTSYAYAGNNLSLTYEEDYFPITGFTQRDSDVPSFSNRTAYLYYLRTTNTIEFKNNGQALEDKTENGVMYGTALEQFYFEPDYPNLEPGAYEFAGWYTTEKGIEGTEVDWDRDTMPDGNLLLHAKYVPITHTVEVYKDASLSEQIGETQTVDHNAFAIAPEDVVTNGNYVFQGWFYTDANGTEKAFVFSGIPIKQNLKIYAKWSSHVSVDYEIQYLLYGTEEPIAEPMVGSALAGHNKTFEAKAGEQLYAGYQTGYFPLVNSHTVNMSVEEGKHEFTFYYRYLPKVPYTVTYVNELTGEIYKIKKVMDNTLSVVTENFIQISGMMPDAYQKRLVLSAEGDDADGDGIIDSNNITFNYNSDDKHAYYRVVHYIQNVAQDGYREYRAEDTVGNIGQEYTFNAISISGFEFNADKTMVNSKPYEMSGTSYSTKLDANGLLVEFFYDRIEVPYTVKYIDGQTGNELAQQESGIGVFGAQVTEYAKNLESIGYVLASENAKFITLSANSDKNVIEFVYQQKYVGIKYQIVGPAGCGILTQESENVAAVSGQPNGSAPIVSKGYAFEGWFTDPECTVPVDNSFVDVNNHFRPEKADDAIWQDGTTYYAKFYLLVTELTITTKSTDAIDTEQAYIFTVKGKDGTNTAGINLTVTVIGDDSVTITELPLGDYTVTELTDWSWRYENDSAERNITLVSDASKNVLIYDNTRTNDKWLDGNSSRLNMF